jgi:hypothetical protein
MIARKQVGQNDMLLSKGISDQKWTRTRLVQHGGHTARAVFLVECEVSDPNRFGYLNGTWWKLEQAEYEAPAAAKRTFHDAMGSYTLEECDANDPDKLFYMSGTHWKMGG